MNPNLRVTNMVVSGKIPTKKKLDYGFIIERSKFLWLLRNEDMSPILSVRFERESKEKNVHKKTKSVYISLWPSGAINLVGVRSLQEAKKFYEKITKELLRIKAISRRSQ